MKPANVLLDERGQVYLSDFGIAKHLLGETTQTEPERWVGTLDFAAPEQIRGEPVDARTDVYALGCVLFFMLDRTGPVRARQRRGALWAHLSASRRRARRTLRPGLAPAFDVVLRRAMAKEPAHRQPTAGRLGREAVAAADGRRPARSRRRAPRSAPRRRRSLAAAPACSPRSRSSSRRLVPGGGARAAAPRRRRRRRPPRPRRPARPQRDRHRRDVGFRPRGVAVAGGDVWVVSHARERHRPDRRGDARARRPEPRVAARRLGIAGDGDAVWVAVPRLGTGAAHRRAARRHDRSHPRRRSRRSRSPSTRGRLDRRPPARTSRCPGRPTTSTATAATGELLAEHRGAARGVGDRAGPHRGLDRGQPPGAGAALRRPDGRGAQRARHRGDRRARVRRAGALGQHPVDRRGRRDPARPARPSPPPRRGTRRSSPSPAGACSSRATPTTRSR